LRFQVVRSSGKVFRQRRPDGSGGWIWNRKGVSELPYRLPELIAAKAKGETIFISEGEKDVEALRSHGLVATCNPGGAGKWRRKFAEYFEGADVVILPDNDTPGQKHVEQVAKILSPVAKRVRILLLPSLPPKGDVSDWIKAGGTAETLLDIAKDVQPYEPSTKPSDWYAECLTGARGQVLSNHANVMLALRCDPAWQDVFAYDEMRRQVMRYRPVPVHGEPPGAPLATPQPWSDVDDARAQEWIQIAGLPHVAGTTVATAISQRAQELSYHPVRDELESLEWDGVPRVEGGTTDEGDIIGSWLATYLGAEENSYTKAVGAMWLQSAVARVFEPGCKADHMLILEGDQGTGKSSACRTLAGEEHFTDKLPDVGSKDAMVHLSGKWIVEVAELDAMSRAEDTQMKAFLTRPVDKFRPPYGRREVEVPRQCVFVGTTNKQAYLKDETGARRYWPVETREIDLEALKRDREQLWAEAAYLYRRDHKWHITDPALLRSAQEEQANRYETDVWEEKVFEYLCGKTEVTVWEVMRGLFFDTPKMDRAATNRVIKILNHLGWKRDKRDSVGRRLYVAPKD
jgi:predicted P-loop ATPase